MKDMDGMESWGGVEGFRFWKRRSYNIWMLTTVGEGGELWWEGSEKEEALLLSSSTHVVALC